MPDNSILKALASEPMEVRVAAAAAFRREEVIEAAVRERKIPASAAPAYRAGLADPAQRQGYFNLLTAKVEDGGLAARSVSMSAAGAPAAGPEAYPTEWLDAPHRAEGRNHVTADEDAHVPRKRRGRVQQEA